MFKPNMEHLLRASLQTLLLLLVAGALRVNARTKPYRNWSVLRVGPVFGPQQVEAVRDFIEDYDGNDNVNILTDGFSLKVPLEIAVSPYEMNHVTSYFDSTAVPYSRLTSNLQRDLDEEKIQNSAARSEIRRRRSATEDSVELPHYYMYHDQMTEYLERIVNASGGRASLFTIGKSYEGHEMVGVVVNNATGLPKVWLDAGIHAREWIAPATALHVLHQLVSNDTEEIRAVTDSFQWYILPLANPDGYRYTWIKDRLWRKNRHPSGPCPDPCKKGIGIDLNRNFNFNWGRFSGTNPCSSSFHGRAPFSEPESRNMRDFILAQRTNMHLYFSLHAYLQLFILPWVGKRYRSPDYPELERVANISAAAMQKVHGEAYKVVNFPEELYLASGSSMDWAKATAGIKYSYTLELRPNTTRPHYAISFQLPPDQIKPTGEEVLAGLLATAQLVKEKIALGEEYLPHSN